MQYIRHSVPSVIVITAFLLIWEVSTTVFNIPMWILPAPSVIFSTLLASSSLLPAHVGMTALEAFFGFALGISVGLTGSFILDFSSLLRKGLYPLLLFSQTIPIIAIAPLLVIWFGYGLLPKVLIVALVTFFPIVVSMLEGLRSSDQDMIRLVQAMGGNRWQVFKLVRLPHSLPYLFSGLRIGATYSVLAAVISEWVGAKQGLGIFLTRAQNAFATDKVFVAIAMITILSSVMFLLIVGLGRLLMPWQYRQQKK